MIRKSYYRRIMELKGIQPAQSHTPVRRETPKVGRNELCPCGSGKKFKRCCA